LQAQQISAEVIDPRSLAPLDTPAILKSVAKTGRLIIVDEDYPSCGMASEIAAVVSADAFYSLQHPVERITPPASPAPFSPVMERYYIPDAERVVECATRMMKRHSAAVR